jgi:hypothetical protein
VTGSCEHGNETSGSIKGEEFLEQLSDEQFFKDFSTELVIADFHLYNTTDHKSISLSFHRISEIKMCVWR